MKTFVNYLLNKQWILNIVMHFLSKEKQEKIVISQFRNELAFFGHDTSEMTDEELKEGVSKVSEMVRACSFTTEEMECALRAISSSKIIKKTKI